MKKVVWRPWSPGHDAIRAAPGWFRMRRKGRYTGSGKNIPGWTQPRSVRNWCRTAHFRQRYPFPLSNVISSITASGEYRMHCTCAYVPGADLPWLFWRTGCRSIREPESLCAGAGIIHDLYREACGQGQRLFHFPKNFSVVVAVSFLCFFFCSRRLSFSAFRSFMERSLYSLLYKIAGRQIY